MSLETKKVSFFVGICKVLEKHEKFFLQKVKINSFEKETFILIS